MKSPIASFISAEQTLDLRSRVLRPNQPPENYTYAEDTLPSTFHIGVISDGRIVSNGTFMQQPHEKFSEAKLPYRLRGMATDPTCQGQGYGKLILEAAVAELKKRNCDLLWFNARVSAEEFYKKSGYKAIEEIFDIPTVGAHKVMYNFIYK